jgi:pyruvate/2-oxoglutarate/acetoin dehydrogenase E1 component
VAEVGRASVEREGTDVTIVATMLMVHRATQAANLLADEGISAEVIDLRWIKPMDLPTVSASVEKTGRLVVAEEQWHDAGWGASLISRLVRSRTSMSAPPRVVGLPDDQLIPYAPPLEDAVIPSAARIAEEVRASLYS